MLNKNGENLDMLIGLFNNLGIKDKTLKKNSNSHSNIT